jgi:LysW-gamma-L-lysine carboxypeptidase
MKDELTLLENLLRIYSPTGQEAEAVNYLVADMRAAGLEAFVDEAGNAVGVCGSGTETVMLLGHIDTVPGYIPVVREGDRLMGRGAVDAKGPLACFVAAAARLGEHARGGHVGGGHVGGEHVGGEHVGGEHVGSEHVGGEHVGSEHVGGEHVGSEHVGSPLRRRLIVVGAVGEEGDSRGAHFVKDKYRPAYTIIGEPSGWEKITLGYKGSAWFEYRVQRALGHTSAQRESACEAAVGFWNRVGAWANTRNDHTKMFDQVNPTLRGMSSDSDGFVECAGLKFGVRLPLGLSVPELDVSLRELLDDAELALLEGTPAYRGEKNTPLVRAFLAAIREAGGSPTFTLKSGTSDMNIVAPVWGTPILAYGPGDSTLDHTPEEHILVSEYLRAIDVLVGALMRL